MTEAAYIQDNEFDELLTYEGPVVVDYTAKWCGPCRLIAPFIDKLAAEYKGRAKVVKIDIDNNKDKVKQYEIKSIPAVLFFKGGEVVEKIIGKATYEEFSQLLEKHI
ncbi:MAG: thioredoxin [Moorea sp. SIO2B7]|nr:thioredoxin [Moorena sp. SIO2B7]